MAYSEDAVIATFNGRQNLSISCSEKILESILLPIFISSNRSSVSENVIQTYHRLLSPFKMKLQHSNTFEVSGIIILGRKDT